MRGHNTEICRCYMCKAKRGETSGSYNPMYGRSRPEMTGKNNPMANSDTKRKHKDKLNTLETKKKLSAAGKNNWNDPAHRERMLSQNIFISDNPMNHQRYRDKLLQKWKDPEYIKKQRKSRNLKPNSAEKKAGFFSSGNFSK